MIQSMLHLILKEEKIQKFNLEHNKNLSDLRSTVDQKNDMQLVEYVFKNFNNNFKWEKLIKSQKKNVLFKSRIDQKR